MPALGFEQQAMKGKKIAVNITNKKPLVNIANFVCVETHDFMWLAKTQQKTWRLAALQLTFEKLQQLRHLLANAAQFIVGVGQ